MTKLITWCKVLFAEIGTILLYYIGGTDRLIYTLVAFVAVDYITGVCSAVVRKSLDSRVGYKGIFHKILIFGLVGIAHLLDANILNTGDVLRTAVILYYIANEGISIIENAGEMGLPIPPKLLNVLEQLKGENDDSKQ